MWRLIKFIVVAMLFTVALPCLAQNRNQFAIGLVPNANNGLISFAIMTKIGENYITAQHLSRQQFMYFSLGYWPSKANIEKVNLYAKYDIKGVELTYDDFGKVNGYTCGPIDQLWRIKYQHHPMFRDRPAGWSQSPYSPSESQAKYLFETYGVLNVNTHYFVGEKLFQLLKDIQDPNWVAAYQALQ
jgi:hypothetical protein